MKVRFLNRSSGISGSAALASTTQKATSKATPITPSPMIRPEPQAYWVPPQVVRRMMAVTPDDMNAVPSQSILWGTRRGRDVEHGGDGEQGDDADGHVDVEDPSPRQVLGEQPTRQRADDARDAEHGAEVPHVLAALAGRDHVAGDRLGPHHQTAGADALHGPGGDQTRPCSAPGRTSIEPTRKITIDSWKRFFRP